MTSLQSRTVQRRRTGRFYVYVYHSPNNGFFNKYKAVVHWGSCGFCNYGEGCHPNADHSSGEWNGPFATMTEAHQKVRMVLDYHKSPRCLDECKLAEKREGLSAH
jgi:hypothetical protein